MFSFFKKFSNSPSREMIRADVFFHDYTISLFQSPQRENFVQVVERVKSACIDLSKKFVEFIEENTSSGIPPEDQGVPRELLLDLSSLQLCGVQLDSSRFRTFAEMMLHIENLSMKRGHFFYHCVRIIKKNSLDLLVDSLFFLCADEALAPALLSLKDDVEEFLKSIEPIYSDFMRRSIARLRR